MAGTLFRISWAWLALPLSSNTSLDCPHGLPDQHAPPQEGATALTVYLINSRSSLPDGETYLYSYEEEGEPRCETGRDRCHHRHVLHPPFSHRCYPSPPASQRVSFTHGCPGTLYVSSVLPYVWVDISAGPTMYGPWLGGHRGQVGPIHPAATSLWRFCELC